MDNQSQRLTVEYRAVCTDGFFFSLNYELGAKFCAGDTVLCSSIPLQQLSSSRFFSIFKKKREREREREVVDADFERSASKTGLETGSDVDEERRVKLVRPSIRATPAGVFYALKYLQGEEVSAQRRTCSLRNRYPTDVSFFLRDDRSFRSRWLVRFEMDTEGVAKTMETRWNLSTL